MQNNLTARSVVIVVIILVCVFGIIGFPKSTADLKKNWDNNIRLGLDLKGGSHLVMQVQVQDAVKAEADIVINRLKDDLKKQNISWTGLERNDPQRVEDADSVTITVKGIPATQSSAFRNLINERDSDWVLTTLNSTDYSLRMKPSELVNLKRDTVERTIQTIGNRIDQYGLAEKSVQQYGRAGDEYQVLVQLPGVDDPAHVKELIGTAAVLEISEVKDGPFQSREAAIAAHGGVLPLNTKVLKMLPRGGGEGDQWYIVTRSPIISGRDMRNARAGQDEYRKWETDFSLSQDGGKRFGNFTGAHIQDRLAVVLDQNIVSVATIQSKI